MGEQTYVFHVQVINEDIIRTYHNRGRKQFSPQAVAILERVFIEEQVTCYNKPGSRRIREIAQETNETEKRILTWFTNRAARKERPYKPVEPRQAYAGLTLEEHRLLLTGDPSAPPPAIINNNFREKKAKRKIDRITYRSGRQAKREEDSAKALAECQAEQSLLDGSLMGPQIQPQPEPQVPVEEVVEANSPVVTKKAKKTRNT